MCGCRCAPTHRGRPVDAEQLNRGLHARQGGRYSFLIVPGYTPRLRWWGGLHPKNIERLAQALHDLEAGLASSLIVTGGAVHSPDNEAVLMRSWLLARGVDPSRILVEPCARHSTTNLRNSGRMVLES